jgi:hypothetical protein
MGTKNEEIAKSLVINEIDKHKYRAFDIIHDIQITPFFRIFKQIELHKQLNEERRIIHELKERGYKESGWPDDKVEEIAKTAEIDIALMMG